MVYEGRGRLSCVWNMFVGRSKMLEIESRKKFIGRRGFVGRGGRPVAE